MRGRTEQRIHGWAILIWAGPGAAISYLLRQSVEWLVFLSVYAIFVSHIACWVSAKVRAKTEK